MTPEQLTDLQREILFFRYDKRRWRKIEKNNNADITDIDNKVLGRERKQPAYLGQPCVDVDPDWDEVEEKAKDSLFQRLHSVPSGEWK